MNDAMDHRRRGAGPAERAMPNPGETVKAQMMRVLSGPGRVMVGPKRLRHCYARIVSLKDGSGGIERYDPRSGTWMPAPESITFGEIWSAPSAASPDGVSAPLMGNA